MDFYHSPGSSSQAAHIMLREAKLAFRPHKVDIFSHTVEGGFDYMQVNSNGYVPALVLDDGMLLTENVAILDWIANQSVALLPGGKMGRTRHLQMLAFLSTEVQKPFVPLFFLEDQEEQARQCHWSKRQRSVRSGFLASATRASQLGRKRTDCSRPIDGHLLQYELS
ncbi:glutathione S-transferase N-terminal domain-containing protein (plasmid) [Ensifer sp. D2-11]